MQERHATDGGGKSEVRRVMKESKRQASDGVEQERHASDGRVQEAGE